VASLKVRATNCWGSYEISAELQEAYTSDEVNHFGIDIKNAKSVFILESSAHNQVGAS
jgi:hypothetical protein